MTTKTSDTAEASNTTSPIDQTLLTMISNGVTGMTSRCSTVPCSRSRMRAAPVSTIDRMVMLVMTFITAPNQPLFSSALNLARSTRSTGSGCSLR
ncbi:hypothetical protein D3C72_2276200 [compost metagenome]